MQKSIYTP